MPLTSDQMERLHAIPLIQLTVKGVHQIATTCELQDAIIDRELPPLMITALENLDPSRFGPGLAPRRMERMQALLLEAIRELRDAVQALRADLAKLTAPPKPQGAPQAKPAPAAVKA